MNFTIEELLKSDIGTKLKIDNVPKDLFVYTNLMRLVVDVLQPLRNRVNKPVIVTSGYRSKVLNEIVNGAYNSQHMSGEAVDIQVSGLSVQQIINLINNLKLPYDQLIHEKTWLHISLKEKNNRKEILYV